MSPINGNLDVDIMRLADGACYVLDLSPRFGDYPFSYEAGVNMPLAILKWLRGEPVAPSIIVSVYGRMFTKKVLRIPSFSQTSARIEAFSLFLSKCFFVK